MNTDLRERAILELFEENNRRNSVEPWDWIVLKRGPRPGEIHAELFYPRWRLNQNEPKRRTLFVDKKGNWFAGTRRRRLDGMEGVFHLLNEAMRVWK